MVNNKEIQKTNRRVKKKGNIDYTIIIAVYTLVIIGIVMVFSASSIQAQIEHEDTMFFLKKQLFFAVIGTFGLIIASHVNYNFYRKNAFAIFSLSIILLFLTAYTPIGKSINQAKRWIKIGFLFQTSEYSKFALIVAISTYIANNKNRMGKVKTVIPPLIMAGLTFALIYVEPSFSAAIIVMATAVAMLFIGGMNMTFTLGLGAVGVFGAAIMATKKSYRSARIMAFLDPFKSMSKEGWQTSNSIMAIASGGLFGKGFGKSTQKYFYLPQPQNDFIFAIIGEELGFVMSMIVILIYIYLIFRIFKLFVSTDDVFAKMMSAGIGIQLGLQTFLNLGVATGGIPNTGVGLPFISYGGTSIIMFLSMIGVLLNISKYTIKRG